MNMQALTELQSLIADINIVEINEQVKNGTFLEWICMWKGQADRLIMYLLTNENSKKEEL